MKRFACNEVLGDLPFELDAVGAVLGHGFHPLKARQPRSIPNLKSVHRQGRIPRRTAPREAEAMPSRNGPNSCHAGAFHDQLSRKACQTRHPWNQCSWGSKDPYRGGNSARNQGWAAFDP
jgi:hypothetical protein